MICRSVRAKGRWWPSRNPLQGLDEAGYAEVIGSAEYVNGYLKIISFRLATMMEDEILRRALLRRIQSAEAKEVNLAAVAIKNQGILNALSADFHSEIIKKGIEGRLAEEIIRGNSDAEAFLKVSQSLFGLRLRLYTPESGVWNTDEAMPVFHNPTTDESVTRFYEGFAPNGQPTSIDFHAKEVPYPLLYLSQDENFFRRPENLPIQASTMETYPLNHRNHIGSMHVIWHVLSDLIKPPRIYADGGTHDPCYHERKVYLSWITISDAHEGRYSGYPEIFTNVKLKYPTGWTWQTTHLIEVNEVDVLYSYSPAVEICNHSGETCDFYPYFPYPKEDHVVYEVKEDDPFPNPDDKVAKWNHVPTSDNVIQLAEDSYVVTSWPQHARINVGSNY